MDCLSYSLNLLYWLNVASSSGVTPACFIQNEPKALKSETPTLDGVKAS